MIDGPLYFGCVEGVGHFLHARKLQTLRWGGRIEWMRRLDGLLPPQDCLEIEGEARLHVMHGWTVIAFWDRSIDSRGKSNSVFFVPGVRSWEYALSAARDAFPSVFARFTFEVRLKGAHLAEEVAQFFRKETPA